MPDRSLHHIGFVVASIAASAEGFVSSLGGSWDGLIFEDPIQKVKVTFLTPRPCEPRVELIEPASDDSPVRKFLLQKGGGLHHFCYETSDLEAEMKDMRSRRAMLVRNPQPAVAFNGRRIAWLLTRENLLVELLEA